MADLNPKQLIQQVFINETGMLIFEHPYIAFMIMGMGIEILGRCIMKEKQNWNEERISREAFERAINHLHAMVKYKSYIGKRNKYDLYGFLRCGLVHSGVPKYAITLSSKDEMEHLKEFNDRLNLRCEDFYADFKLACEEIIEMDFPSGDKMNKVRLIVPDLISVNLFYEQSNFKSKEVGLRFSRSSYVSAAPPHEK